MRYFRQDRDYFKVILQYCERFIAIRVLSAQSGALPLDTEGLPCDMIVERQFFRTRQ